MWWPQLGQPRAYRLAWPVGPGALLRQKAARMLSAAAGLLGPPKDSTSGLGFTVLWGWAHSHRSPGCTFLSPPLATFTCPPSP